MEGLKMIRIIKATRYFITLVILLIMPKLIYGQNGDLLKAAFLLDQERYEDVLSVLNNVSPAPQETKVYFDILGKAAFQYGDYDLALTAYKKRSELDDSGMAYYQLARINFINNQKSTGYEFLVTHLKSDNHLPLKVILTDEVFDNLVRDREWIRFWSKEWYNEKDDLIAEARAQLNQEEPDVRIFQQLQLKYPEESVSWFLSGRFFELIENSRRAISSFNKAIDLEPESIDYINYIAMFYAGSKKYDASSELISKSLQINLYQPSIWMLRINNHLNLNDNQAAIKEMQFLERIGIESPDLWISLAMQMRTSDLPAAIGLLDRAINQNPLSITAFNNRADLYRDNQDYDKAMEDWAMSLDVNPRQADIYFMRGEVRYQLGDSEGACHDWRKALRYGHRKAIDMLHKYCD